MMGTGREAAVPSEAPSIQNRTAPPPALRSTLFNLKPQALPPPDLGQFLKGCALSILKDRFSYSTPSLSKTNRNYTPPTQIQLDPDSSGQRAVAVDLGKGKKKKNLAHDNKVIGLCLNLASRCQWLRDFIFISKLHL